MNEKEFINRLKSKQREIENLTRRRLPIIVGRMAKDHFQENFRQGGFVNGGIHKWPDSKRQSSGYNNAASQYGPLLSSRRHLFSSIKYTPGNASVTVSNDLPYAAIHNNGGTVNVSVTPKMKRYAWAKYYELSGRGTDRNGKKRKRSKATEAADNAQASFWKRLALTKKTSMQIRIPQRQFIGESRELREKINERINQELKKLLES
jgi:phage gpG-like protein